MACNLLSGSGKTASAIVLQKAGAFGIETAYIEQASAEVPDRKVIKPFSTIGRVENLNPFNNRLEYFSCVLRQIFALIALVAD
jgi:hypothetical protein